MNHEELAFVNQQLAGMLKCGIPLEGSLKQLCSTMRRGKLRAELESLEADLAKGTPLKDALAARQLPDFYKHMLVVGAQANDLPGVLTMLADYYSRINTITARLKGLMVYPSLVLIVATVLSFVFALMVGTLLTGNGGFLTDMGFWGSLPFHLRPHVVQAKLFAPVITLIVLTVIFLVAVSMPRSRNWLRWRVPGLREASLSSLAGAMEVLLRGGIRLPESLALVSHFERGNDVSVDLSKWQSCLVEGRIKTSEIGEAMKQLPPAFLWLVASAGEDVASGFERAADFYRKRADHRIDLMLFAALPVSIMLLGGIVAWQLLPLAEVFRFMTNSLM